MTRASGANLLRTLVALGAVACLDAFEARMDAVPLDPLPVYRDLWAQVESCSRLTGDFNRVRWFVIPDTTFRCGTIDGCAGAWMPPHSIYLSEPAVRDSLSNYRTVQHEMLHDLLGGGADHPPVFGDCLLMPLFPPANG
jgi:hypothetical protein